MRGRLPLAVSGPNEPARPRSPGASGSTPSEDPRSERSDMAGKLEGKTIAFLRHRRRRAGRADRAVEGGRGGRRHARADLARGRRGPGVQPPRQGRHVPASTAPRRTPTRRDYDGLVLPGGVANPDFLRTDEDAVAFVRAFFEQGKPVAAICHAPWTLIDADVVRGPHAHLVAVAADRPPQRGRDLGRRGGPRRPGPRHLAPARTTCRRSAPSSSRRSPRACTRASARARSA